MNVTLSGLQTWVAGLAFLVATIIALFGAIKYGPKGEWGQFLKVVGIAVVVMIITGSAFLTGVQGAGDDLVKQVTPTVKQ